MPYKKSKRSYKKRSSAPWYRKKYSVTDMAKSAWKGVKFLKGLVNVEKNEADSAINTTFSTTSSVTLLTTVAQGNDDGNRSGNSILAKYLYIRAVVYRDSANTVQQNFCRYLIVKDLQNTGTAPTLNDLLENVVSGAGVYSPLSKDHSPRYQVLVDNLFCLLKNQSDAKVIKHFIPINDHIKFTGSASTDVYTNNIYLLCYGDIASISNPPIITGNARLAFYDN